MNRVPVKSVYEVDIFMYGWLLANKIVLSPTTTYVLFTEDGRAYETKLPRREGLTEQMKTWSVGT